MQISNCLFCLSGSQKAKFLDLQLYEMEKINKAPLFFRSCMQYRLDIF